MEHREWIRRHGHKLDPHLKRHCLRCADKGLTSAKVRLIVQFHHKDVHRHGKALKRRIGGLDHKSFQHLPLIQAIALHGDLGQIRDICGCRFVKRVYLDRKRKISLNVASPTIGAPAAHRSGASGKGVSIAVLDTGVYPHPDLTRPVNRIRAFKDFVGFKTKPYDDNGHGTHCAGDALGNGFASRGKYKGPAPQANLVAVKVLDKQGSGYDSTIIRGIQWCIQNRKRHRIRVMSLSFGGPDAGSCRRDALCQAVGSAWKKGIVVVAAAGNEGPKRQTIDSPGTSPLVITVGASNDRGTVDPKNDTAAGFSSRGPTKAGVSKPDLMAPGSGITSLRSPGSLLDRTVKKAKKGKWYFTLSGTSMSTPIAAGAAALLLQKRPGLRPGQVKRLLKKHALHLGYKRSVQGSGLTNVRFLSFSRLFRQTSSIY